MDNQISIEDFKGKLHHLFCEINRESKKYSEVWLSDEDFGGLYESGKYVLNVKAEHNIDSCSAEIKYIINLLFDKLSGEERALVWRVAVYNSDDQIHCQSMDELIYSLENACD